MRYAPRHRASYALETFAITDIVLNLFIFFFITFALAYIPKNKAPQTAVSVELPRTGRGETRESAGPLLISLKTDQPEKVYIGDKEIAFEKLTDELRAMTPEQLARGAILRCDRTVSIERTLQTLDALQQAGIRDASVATEPKP